VTVLRGHVSEDTAYVVGDYPYGFSLRCTIRYWLHTAPKGKARGQVRFMSQTTNPKRPGEPWNKPKASTYYLWAVMHVDARQHVSYQAIGFFGPDPFTHLRMRVQGIHGQLTDTEREGYDALVRRGVTSDPEGWGRARRAYRLLAGGAGPDELVDAHHIYLNDLDREVASAAIAAGLEF